MLFRIWFLLFLCPSGSAHSFPFKGCSDEIKEILFVLECQQEVIEQIHFMNKTVNYLLNSRNWVLLKTEYMTLTDKRHMQLNELTGNSTEYASEITKQCNVSLSEADLFLLSEPSSTLQHPYKRINIIFLNVHRLEKDLLEVIDNILDRNNDNSESNLFFFLINQNRSAVDFPNLSHRGSYNKNLVPSPRADIEKQISRPYFVYTSYFKDLNIFNIYPKICDLICTNTNLTFVSQNIQKSYYHVDVEYLASHDEAVKLCNTRFNSDVISTETLEEINFLMSDILKVYDSPLNNSISFNVPLGLVVSPWYTPSWSSGNPFTLYNELPHYLEDKCVYFSYSTDSNVSLPYKDDRDIWKYLRLLDCDHKLDKTYIVCECHKQLSPKLDFEIKPLNNINTSILFSLTSLYTFLRIFIDDDKNPRHQLDCTHSTFSNYSENIYLCNVAHLPPFQKTYVRAKCFNEPFDCFVDCIKILTFNNENELNLTAALSEPYCDNKALLTSNGGYLLNNVSLSQEIPIVSCKEFPKVFPKCIHVEDDGCRDNSHLQNCQHFTCPYGFLKCPNAYRISLDKSGRCPLRQEKVIFAKSNIICSAVVTFKRKYTCLYFNNDSFLPNVYGLKHKFRELSCSFRDQEKSLPTVKLNIQLYNISNKLLPLMNYFFLHVQFTVANLIGFSAPNCKIKNVEKTLELWAMEHNVVLDLSNNEITDIDHSSSITSMTSLVVLNLSHNFQMSINYNFKFPKHLQVLDLSYSSVDSLPVNSLENLTDLKLLDLRYTRINKYARMGLPKFFKLNILNIQGLIMSDVTADFFHGLTIHEGLYTSDFRMCCPQIRGVNISSEKCHAPLDTISTCQHIVGDFFKRVLVWTVGTLTIVGNIVVLTFRVGWNRKKTFHTAYGMFVSGLALSDLLMGIYLIIIACVDLFYADVYVLHEASWRKSSLCHFSGFLSTLSSETSTFLISLITLDRFVAFTFPFKAHEVSKNIKLKGFICSWIVGFSLALVPLIVPRWQIYSSNGLCLALPLSIPGAKKLPGWEFSMTVYVIVNFILFLFILFGQIGIFVSIYKQRNLPTGSRCTRRTHDIHIAKKLAFVALSDALSWIPIGIISIMSLCDIEFERDVYAWVAILVLPVNSALNPMIYTIPIVIGRWRRRA